MSTASIGEARDHLSRLLAAVETTHDRVVLTNHGREVAAIVSIDDLRALEETVDLLGTPGAAAAVEEGRADDAAGRTVGPEALDEFFRRD